MMVLHREVQNAFGTSDLEKMQGNCDSHRVQ